jgi:surface polysaccharide O-acyltransferase-like enzyme
MIQSKAWFTLAILLAIFPLLENVIEWMQHELHLWIYYMSKFLNTSEFINMINSRHLTPNTNP